MRARIANKVNIAMSYEDCEKMSGLTVKEKNTIMKVIKGEKEYNQNI